MEGRLNLRDIPIYVERRGKKRRLQVLRRIVEDMLTDWRDGLVSRKAAAEILAFRGLPLGRALELLAMRGRK